MSARIPANSDAFPLLGSRRDRLRALFTHVAEHCDLPPLPAVAMRAIAMARNPVVRLDDLVTVVGSDPAIAARVLRMSRSTFYARACPPATLRDAVLAIGLGSLRTVLVAASARAFHPANDAVAETLWRHSLAVAFTADEIEAARGRPRGGSGFIAGLLHEIGWLVFHLADPTAHARLAAGRVGAEVEAFGVSHAAVGASLAEQWGLGDDVVEAILSHHDFGLHPLGDVVFSADRIAHDIGFGLADTPVDVPAPVAGMAPAALCDRVVASLRAQGALFA